MQLLLKDIADIRTGFTLRGRGAARHSAEKGLPLLRISDVSPSGQFKIESPQLIDPEQHRIDDFRVISGDVIVANRGSRMTAAAVPREGDAIAGGQFFIVRVKRNSVLPEYLVWYINQEPVQERLKVECRGSYVQTLPIDSIRKLSIPVPNLETQTKIVEILKLAEEEESIALRIHRLRQKRLDAVLNKMASESVT